MIKRATVDIKQMHIYFGKLDLFSPDNERYRKPELNSGKRHSKKDYSYRLHVGA